MSGSYEEAPLGSIWDDDVVMPVDHPQTEVGCVCVRVRGYYYPTNPPPRHLATTPLPHYHPTIVAARGRVGDGGHGDTRSSRHSAGKVWGKVWVKVWGKV